MKSIALIGDGSLDNEMYAEGEPSVAESLSALLPLDWQVAVCAAEGTAIVEVPEQFPQIPANAAHLVVSMGGVDALVNVDLLNTPVESTAEGLDLFARRLARFREHYVQTLRSLLELGIPTTLCTIYNGRLSSTQAPRARIALMMFNDVVGQVAVEYGLNLIELRHVCDEPHHFATPIAPSGEGGRGIATAIARSLGFLVDDKPRASVVTSG